jgi:hypothetical protein
VGILTWLRVQWDRAAAGAAFLAGLAALGLGWLGISDSLYVVEQLPYLISGGLVGLFLLGFGAVMWISADLRDEWRELRGLRELHAERLPLITERVDADLAREHRAGGTATRPVAAATPAHAE